MELLTTLYVTIARRQILARRDGRDFSREMCSEVFLFEAARPQPQVQSQSDLGWSPGLVVMRENWFSRGREFDSQHRTN